MKINLKLNVSDNFYSHRNIRLCASEIQRIFGIGEDVKEVALTVSLRRFIGSVKTTVYCQKVDFYCPMIRFSDGDTQQILIDTFEALAKRVGIKVESIEGNLVLTPQVVYVRITAK